MTKTALVESDWRLVPLVIRDRKEIGIPFERLFEVIEKREKPSSQSNPGDWPFTHEVSLGTSQGIPVKLRLCFPIRCNIPEAWSCSLVMFNIRIDCIDHHVKAPDGRGGICRGWHRHEWDDAKRSCDHLRNPLPSFDPGDTIEAFVYSCCDVMNVHAANEGAKQC